MIEILALSKKFTARTVLEDINLTIAASEKVLITGQNGAGKTTLMRAILGQIICAGEVKICGIDPRKDREKALANIAFVPQTPPPLRLSVSEICDFCVRTSGGSLESIKSYLAAIDFSYDAERGKPFYKLSGGMKQKLLIAVALSKNCAALMFDEPTANLDPKARAQFLDMLREFGDKTIVFISHRLSDVRGMVTREIKMDLGRITGDKKLGQI